MNLSNWYLNFVNLIATLLGDVDEIMLGVDVGIEIRSIDWSFDGFKDGKFEVLFLGNPMV